MLADSVSVSVLGGVDADASVCIHTLFEAQVRATPDVLALVGGSTRFTYRELNEEANRLAGLLIQRGVRPNTFVGCYVSRSASIVVYILAILKAGGAYVLLDTFLPDMRLKHMVGNAEPDIIIADTALPEVVGYSSQQTLTVDELQAAKWQYPTDNPVTEVQPDNIAYLAYTSGSTGKPKAAIISHASTTCHARAFIRLFNLSAADRTPMLAPVAFDMATEEIIPSLLAGSMLIISAAQHDDMPAFHQEIIDNGYTILNVPVPLWYAWLEYLERNALPLPDSLRLVIVGSDKILTKKFRDWQRIAGASKVAWAAAYGTTETTITSSFYLTAWQDDLDDEPTIPIGKPIANTTMYILDETGQPVKGNTVGDLYIGGAGVGLGYYKLEDKTRLNFVPDPFAALSQARMYRTGDEARYRPDGNIVCLGRKDSQVKIHSLRIELEEIEAVLLSDPRIRQAVAVVADKLTEDPYIHAFVVIREGGVFDEAALLQRSQHYLHPLMLPREVTCLLRIPLTTSGKLDRKALEQYNSQDKMKTENTCQS